LKSGIPIPYQNSLTKVQTRPTSSQWIPGSYFSSSKEAGAWS